MNSSATRLDLVSGPVDAKHPVFQALVLRAIHETSPDGILVVDEAGVVVSHNRRFLEVWGIPDPGRETIGSPDRPLLAAAVARVRDKDAFLARVRELYANPELDDLCEVVLLDGRTLERHSTALRDAGGAYLGRVWFFRDISGKKATEAELLRLARHDPLTGIANRRYFLERAGQEFARARRHPQPLGLAILDVDRFKQTNDLHGHAVGDQVLLTLCQTAQRVVRGTDLLGRIGGEEFALLMPDTGLDGAVHLAERLREAATGLRIPVPGGAIGAPISVGVTELSTADASIEDCLRRADRAMYRAKALGRNRVEAETP